MFYQRSVLPNGLQVITEHVPNVRSVALGMWVGYGARDEPDHLRGAAHFLEHLLFKGTGQRTAVEISEAFESLGAEFNALTAKEYTAYHARFLDQHLPVAVDILCDMLDNSLLKPDDVEAEREVIIEEIRAHEDTPDDHIHDVFLQTLWPNHSLGHPVAGFEKVIAGMSRADLNDLYGKIYEPGRIVVAATGNIDHDELVGLISERFKDSAAGGGFERLLGEPAVGSERLFVHRRQTEQAHIVMGGPGMRAHDPERFDLLVLDCILGGGMSSRLFQEIREKNSLAYSVYSHYAMYTETGYFSIYAGTRPGRAREAIDRIKGELDKLASGGATDEEVFRCREHIKGSLVLSFESTAARMFRLGKAVISQGEILSLDELVERIDSVTTESVNALAARLLGQGGLVTTVIGPFSETELSAEAS